MPHVDFVRAVDRVLGYEAGYVNDPADPGGETKWGISKRSYPNLNIAGLSRADAMAIYYRDFWQKVCGDELAQSPFTDGTAYQLLDCAVHCGPKVAIRLLQRALDVADDGYFGPVSKDALRRMPEAKLLLRFIAERMEYQGKLKNWATYGRGWNNRNAANLRYAAEDISC